MNMVILWTGWRAYHAAKRAAAEAGKPIPTPSQFSPPRPALLTMRQQAD